MGFTLANNPPAITLHTAVATTPASGTVEVWSVDIAAPTAVQQALPTIVAGSPMPCFLTATGEIIYVTAGLTTTGTQNWTLQRAMEGSPVAAAVLNAVIQPRASAASIMTDPETTVGDMIYRDGTNATARLPLGSYAQPMNVVVGNPFLTSPSAPGLAVASSGGAIGGIANYIIKITYVNAQGETTGSASSTANVGSNSTSTITVTSPPAQGSGTGVATGYYVYSTGPNQSTPFYRQQVDGSPTPIGTDYVRTAAIKTTGTQIPTANTAGTLLPGYGRAGTDVNKVQLDWTATADNTGSLSATPSTWGDVTGTSQTFTVDSASSLVEIAVTGGCLVTLGATTTHIASQVVVDAAGAPVSKLLGMFYTGQTGLGNPLAGGGSLFFSGLAAGSHTVKVQIASESASANWYARAASYAGRYETVSIRVIEHKG